MGEASFAHRQGFCGPDAQMFAGLTTLLTCGVVGVTGVAVTVEVLPVGGPLPDVVVLKLTVDCAFVAASRAAFTWLTWPPVSWVTMIDVPDVAPPVDPVGVVVVDPVGVTVVDPPLIWLMTTEVDCRGPDEDELVVPPVVEPVVVPPVVPPVEAVVLPLVDPVVAPPVVPPVEAVVLPVVEPVVVPPVVPVVEPVVPVVVPPVEAVVLAFVCCTVTEVGVLGLPAAPPVVPAAVLDEFCCATVTPRFTAAVRELLAWLRACVDAWGLLWTNDWSMAAAIFDAWLGFVSAAAVATAPAIEAGAAWDAATAIWATWVGAAMEAAAVTADAAALAFPAVEDVVAVTAVIAWLAKFVACAGTAALATATTWDMRFAEEPEEMLPMLFCTMLDTVVIAVCTTAENAGLAATACESGIGGWGSPPGGVIVTFPAATE